MADHAGTALLALARSQWAAPGPTCHADLKVNEDTLRSLTQTRDSGAAGTTGRKVSEVISYRSHADVPIVRDYVIQVTPCAEPGPGLRLFMLLCCHAEWAQRPTPRFMHGWP